MMNKVISKKNVEFKSAFFAIVAMSMAIIAIGNIYDVWNSDAMIKIRKGVLKGRRENELCRKCNATPPRTFGLSVSVGLALLDMSTIAKSLAVMGYNRPKQY